MITISVLLMVVGLLVIAVGVGFVFALKCEQASSERPWEILRYYFILITVMHAWFLSCMGMYFYTALSLMLLSLLVLN